MNYEPSPILGAIAIVFVIAGAICALWAGLHAIGKWADRRAAVWGVRRKHELLGESLLKACGSDLTRAYAEIERHMSLTYQRSLALKAAQSPRDFKDEYLGNWAPQPQVDRAGTTQGRREALAERMCVGIRLVDTSTGIRKALVMERPDPWRADLGMLRACGPIHGPAGADWREGSRDY